MAGTLRTLRPGAKHPGYIGRRRRTDGSFFQFWAARQTKVSCSEKTRAEQLYHKSAASALSRRTIKAKHIKVGSQSEPVVAGSVQGSSLTLLGPAACTQVRPAPVGHRKHREAPADARVCVSYRPRSPCFDCRPPPSPITTMDGGEEAGPYHLVLSSITLIARPPVVHVSKNPDFHSVRNRAGSRRA